MSIIKTAIRRPVTVSMCVIAVTLFGIVSLNRLPVSLLPDISYPSLTIQTDFPDAAPEEVEALVTRPIEEMVGTISGLVRLSSTSRPGQSEVLLEFGWSKDMDVASAEVREKLDLFQRPLDVTEPVILRFDPSNDPIMRVHLFGIDSLSRLRYLADRELKKKLESTEGVAAVKIVGGREEQIHIEVDEKRLAELGIPITQITRIIEQSNLNRASGSLYNQDSTYLVRILNEFRSLDEIERLVVRDQSGRKIVLGDVARIWRGPRDREVVAHLNGEESVELAFYKQGDANPVQVSAALRKRLEQLAGSESFPSDLQYRIVFDQSEFISESVDNVLSSGILGGLLATIVLFLFLRDSRSTLVVAAAIPISVMATFTLMYQLEITLNIMSLGGIALGVGMLVDSAIVVLESVDRNRAASGNLQEDVYRGTKQVSMPVTASTLTTVAVFLPLVFVEGIAGQLFRDQALTITFSVVASLIVAVTVIPMFMALGSKLRKKDESLIPLQAPFSGSGSREPRNRAFRLFTSVGRLISSLGRFLFGEFIPILLADLRFLVRKVLRFFSGLLSPLLRLFSSAYSTLERGYPELLRWSLERKPVVIVLVLAIAGLSVLAFPWLGYELIPPLSQGEFSFEVKLPEGRTLDQTERIIRSVERQVLSYPEVETVFSSIGGDSGNQFSGSALEENLGQLHIVLKNRQDRGVEREVIARARQELSRHAEVTASFAQPTLFSFKTPVEVEVFLYDLVQQRVAAGLIADRLEQLPGVKDVRVTPRPGTFEIQIRLRRGLPARMGLDEAQIIEVLHNKIRGSVASLYRDSDRQVEILVRADEENRSTLSDIKNLVINDWTEGPSSFRPGAAIAGSGSLGTIDAVSASNENALPSGSAGQQPTSGSPDLQTTASQVPVVLGTVADITLTRGPNEIRRIGSERAAIVSATVEGRDLGGISEEISRELQALRQQLPAGTVTALGGQNEELGRSYKSLLFAISLAVFLVYLVMASQFESFLHPLIILFTVPLGMIGVLWTLLITGTTVTVIVLLGVIVLAGIVVNNAIVLIDYTNQLRQLGLERREAVMKGAQVRLRPILMTTATTVLGLLPMALGWGEGSEIRSALAITVMGGLLFSTLLTLVLVPIVYELIDRSGHELASQKELTPVHGSLGGEA